MLPSRPAGAVFFDLDSTLVFIDTAIMLEKMRRVCSAIADSTGAEAELLLEHHGTLTRELWHLAETGALNGHGVMLETWRRALAACGCDAEDAAATACDLYWNDRGGIVSCFNDVLASLDAIRGRLPIAVITNGPADTQLDKLQIQGLDAHFDLVLASSELGVLKPDPRIFMYACEKLQVSPEQAWHVGDSLSMDVAGAKAAGLTAVWLNRTGAHREPGQPRPDFEITSLTEVVPLLGIPA